VAKTQNWRESESCRRKNLSSRERTEAAAEADCGPFRRNNEATGRKSTADVTRQKVEREAKKKTLS
jgi:hypothetical protein